MRDWNAYQVSAVEPDIDSKLDTYVFLPDEHGFLLAESMEHFDTPNAEQKNWLQT